MSKISLGQLDLLALQQYLEIVVGFRKKDDRAIDVEYVGEYTHPTIDDTDGDRETEKSRVMAHQIAMAALDDLGYPIAYTDDNGVITIPERQTVLNSLMLDGVPASEFLKRVESDTILTDVNQATYNISDDIRNLKDELYQLKNQLVKVGAIKESNVYNGFIDSFVESTPKNILSTGIKIVSISGNVVTVDVNVENSKNLRPGEIIVLECDGRYNIQKIKYIFGNELTLCSPDEFAGCIQQPEASVGSVILKSLGQSKNGKFVFGCEAKDGKVVANENKYIVKDGVDRVKVFELDHPGHGFGTVIRIPSSLSNNVISSVKVSLAVKGDPGRIEGEFWKYNEATGLFEKINTLTTSGITPMMASSWFNDFELQLQSELEVRPGEKYLFILTCLSGGDADNKWYIGGFNDDECLEDIHDDCYIKESNGGFNEQLWVSPDDKDMFLSLTTKEIKESSFQKLNYGLYTCEFDVYQSLANRIRVELCINQEGQFKIKDNNIVSLAAARTNQIEIEPRGSKLFKDKIFGEGDYAVIGNEICKISSVGTNNGNIIPATDVFVKSNADVYRVGYEIQVVASNRVLEPTMYGAIQRYDNAEVYPLKFVGVVPGRDMIRPDKSSDRLLFEAEFYNQEDLDDIKLKSFDHIEVQVRWFSNVDWNTIEENEILEGAMFDITVSVDQAYTKSENEVE